MSGKHKDTYEIYLATCTPTDKKYVGLTRQGYQVRWLGHVYGALSGKSDVVLARAIRKYGADAFAIEVLRSCKTFEAAQKWEIRYIAKLNTLAPNGMNLTPGGEGVTACLPEVQEKIRSSARANWELPEYQENHKQAMKRVGLRPSYKAARSTAAKGMWQRADYQEKQAAAFERSTAQRTDAAKKMWERPGYREAQTTDARREKGRIAAMKRWHPEEWARLYA